MKTPEEIKKGLEIEIAVHYHLPNPEPRLTPREFMYMEQLHSDALDYIKQLEQRLAQAEEALAFERTYREDQAVSWELKCSLLEREAEQAKRERDAAIWDLQHTEEPCDVCKKKSICEQYCPQNSYDCVSCLDKERCIFHNCTADNDLWQWRGICEENSKEENNG